MKTTSIIKLASKNLYQNFSRSILTLISIILLSIVIMTLCNLSYYYKENGVKNILDYNKEYGIEVNLGIGYDNRGNAKIEKLDNAHITEFVEGTEKLNILYEYKFAWKYLNLGSMNVVPYLGGATAFEGNPPLISGEYWKSEDRGQNFIWIEKEISQSQNLKIDDIMTATMNDSDYEFIVKGIVDDDVNYIDYKYFDIKRISIYDKVNKYENLSISRKLEKFKETAHANTQIGGYTINCYHETKFMVLFIAGVCGFLTLLCILLSIGCILNTLKISIEDNNNSIGIMKALGMRNSKIYQYILAQVGILIIIGTLIATFIAWLIAKLTLSKQLAILLEFIGYNISNHIITGFYFLVSLFNILILALFVSLGSLKMLRKYFRKNAIIIMQEVK
ncbi:MAG: FtsX-like permease family protein [Clostridia bacterium]